MDSQKDIGEEWIGGQSWVGQASYHLQEAKTAQVRVDGRVEESYVSEVGDKASYCDLRQGKRSDPKLRAKV